MRPEPGDQIIDVPITIDYSGGRSDSIKSKLLWSLVATLVLVILFFVILFSAQNFVLKLMAMAIEMYVGTALIRFLLLNESKYRKEAHKRLREDYSINMSDFWNIYQIIGEYCYFISGHIGLFFLLEKGVLVGSEEDSEYEHYEAIADALNLVATSKMRVCHIDMMDKIGHDDRIRKAMRTIRKYPDSGAKDLSEEIFRYQQEMADDSVTSYDIYLFMFKGDEDEFVSSVQKVLSCLMTANYTSYTSLDGESIRTIAATLFNIHDFSVVNATREAFGNRGGKNNITPIALMHSDGTKTRLNKTKEEKAIENEQKSTQSKLISEEKKKRADAEKTKRRNKRLMSLREITSKASKGRVSLPIKPIIEQDDPDDLIDLNSTGLLDNDDMDIIDLDDDDILELEDDDDEEIDLDDNPKANSGKRTSDGSTGFFDLD